MGDIGEMNQQAMNTERRPDNRENNFAILRLVAALMVIAGHMSHLLATSVPTLFDRPIHSLGVYIFFLIGGYLISRSWLSDPHPLRYGVKRFMRIWPPLATFVLCAAFLVGPLLSWLPAGEYYVHPRTWEYLANLRLDIRYVLPGVFEQNPYPHAVNGSLWTLPVEAMMYVWVPVLLTICRAKTHTKKSRWLLLGMCTAVCALVCWQNTYYPQARIVIYGTDWVSALQIIPFYLIGMVCSQFDIKRYLSVQVSLVLILVLSCIRLSYVKMQIVLFFALPYIVFSLALAPNPFFFKLGKKAEISYGLYLYGFFIQQIVVNAAQQKGISLSYMRAFVISCALTTLVAYLSCYFVEKPMQRLTRWILDKLKGKKKKTQACVVIPRKSSFGDTIGAGSRKERYAWISALRMIAMISVMLPHLLAYQMPNMLTRYLAHYVLNPLHIIQFMGAFGVSMFFITSGYLLMPQVGSGQCVKRFFKQVVGLMAEVFVAEMFAMAFSRGCQQLFTSINGHVGFQAHYSLNDWVRSALLMTSYFYEDTADGVLWFLVPFLFFRITLIVLDKPLGRLEKNGNGLFMVYGIMMILFLLEPLIPELKYIIARFFYMTIIMIGYIFALLHQRRIDKKKFVLLQCLNVAMMLRCTQISISIPDDGYIVSALYAAVVFYVFYNVKDLIQPNKLLSYIDHIGLPYYILHNTIGVNLTHLFFYCFMNGVATEANIWIAQGAAVLLMLVIVSAYAYTIHPIVSGAVKKLFSKELQ